MDEIKPSVLLLDIDMPEISGIELRKQLLHIPACLFITSYPDYAVEGFEVAALDYLVKPLKADRFDMAMQRLNTFLEITQKAHTLVDKVEDQTMYIKEGHQKVKINLDEIIYLEALKDYTCIFTPSKKHYVLQSIGHLLKSPGFRDFIRIHRSYAVKKKRINKMNSDSLIVENINLPIGRTYKASINL